MKEIPQEIAADFQQFILIFSLGIFIIWVLFANSVRKTLLLIQKENQVILPNQAWFLAVPLFNIYWNFEVVRRLSYSLNNEFFDRKIAVEELPTMRVGMLFSWTFALFFFPFFPEFIKVVLALLWLASFANYWYKVNQYRILISEHNKWKEEQKDID